MFYGTARHHYKFNSGSLVWGTKWAPRIGKCQLQRNYFYIVQNCSASHAGNLPGLWLSAAQLQVTPKCQEMSRTEQLHTPCRGTPLPLGPANVHKSVCASAATQPNQISSVSRSASGLDYCSKLNSRYTVRNLSLESRDRALVAHLLMHPAIYSPSWTALPSDSMARAISDPQFYTLWHAKANQSIGTYKLG